MLLGKFNTSLPTAKRPVIFIPEEGLMGFMTHCHQRIGEAYFRTPRTTITAFVNLLSVLEQNPRMAGTRFLGQVEVLRIGAVSQTWRWRKDNRRRQAPPARAMTNSPASNSESASFFLLDASSPTLDMVLPAGRSFAMPRNKLSDLILDGSRDVIIAATTASGKTEAAFLPILTRLALLRYDRV